MKIYGGIIGVLGGILTFLVFTLNHLFDDFAKEVSDMVPSLVRAFFGQEDPEPPFDPFQLIPNLSLLCIFISFCTIFAKSKLASILLIMSAISQFIILIILGEIEVVFFNILMLIGGVIAFFDDNSEAS